MNTGFVPISASTLGKMPTASLPIPGAKPSFAPPAMALPSPTAGLAPSRGFQPVTQNISSSCHSGLSEPKVTLERNGDRITKIRIQCVCGHIVELACHY